MMTARIQMVIVKQLSARHWCATLFVYIRTFFHKRIEAEIFLRSYFWTVMENKRKSHNVFK